MSDGVPKWPTMPSRADPDAVKEAFPFPTYRPEQQSVLEQAAAKLYGDGPTDTVVIDAPTGVGKSGINTALCHLARGAFYTTPQKSLRDQLFDDDALRPYLYPLRARADYQCPVGEDIEGEPVSCEECPVNTDPGRSCADFGDRCSYWAAKTDAFDERVVALTFAFLIADSYLPPFVSAGGGLGGQQTISDYQERQISFDDRELLVVDEAHLLEEQTASLHVGLTVSPRTLRQGRAEEYLRDARGENDTTPYEAFQAELPSEESDSLHADAFLPALEAVEGRLNAWCNSLPGGWGRLLSIYRRRRRAVRRVVQGLSGGADWVVETEERDRPNAPSVTVATFKPVRVAEFLANRVWSRADKVVLSTATLPFRENPARWLRRLGLSPATAEIVSADMPFPPENRPVYLGDTVANMSSGGFSIHFDDVVERLTELCEFHAGERGLIHTASYSRAVSVADALGDAALAHTRQTDAEVALAQWQSSDAQVLCSPSMMDGVDLPDDDCRWQALLKVPYASLGDPRVEFLVRERNEWDWYHDVAARRVIQSVGRAVRSPTDHAAYYVLDECFRETVKGRAPGWFIDAIDPPV